MKIRNLLYILILILISKPSFAQQGEDIIEQDRLQYLSPSEGPFGKVQKLGNKKEQILEFETTEQPQFIYKLSTRIPLKAKKGFKKDEVFLVSFKAKTLSSEIETGEARTHWILKQSDSYKDNLEYTLSFSGEWKEYFIPFQLSKNTKAEALGLVIQYGYRPQKFQIKDLKFEYFGNKSLESLPKTQITYAGMEDDADWRKEAFERIQEYRTTEFTLDFSKNGNAEIQNPVQVRLLKHDFSWGAAVGADAILEDPKMLEYLQKGFNKVVFENDLKIKRWEVKRRRETTLKAIEKLEEKGVKIKGHVLIWPGFRYLTDEYEQNQDDPQKIREMITSHVEDIITQTKGNIDNWDVVNEVYTNKDLQNITGSEDILYDGFKIANKLDPGTALFTNEYGIISKGGLDEQKQQWYYDFIKRIDEKTDGLVDGIGIQSHIGSDLTTPEKVLEILDFYAQLGKKISISEFTMDIEDPEIREKYTRDFIIAAFSHPNVSEFLFWGFQENQKGKVDIFNKDWKPGAMGMAFYKLMANEFNTSFVAEPENGKIDGRGYYGIYEYVMIQDNKQVTGTFEIKPGGPKTINIGL